MSLGILRALSEVDDRCHAWAGGSSVVEQLTSAGVMEPLVGMLRDLRPISNPRREQQQQQEQQQAGANAAETGSQVEQPSSSNGSNSSMTYPYQPPYPGYRADIVAVLANSACERRSVQEVRCSLVIRRAPGSLAGVWMACSAEPAPCSQQ